MSVENSKAAQVQNDMIEASQSGQCCGQIRPPTAVITSHTIFSVCCGSFRFAKQNKVLSGL